MYPYTNLLFTSRSSIALTDKTDNQIKHMKSISYANMATLKDFANALTIVCPIQIYNLFFCR